eukprot:1701476-Alexandrium_andersonii.AAC.1
MCACARAQAHVHVPSSACLRGARGATPGAGPREHTHAHQWRHQLKPQSQHTLLLATGSRKFETARLPARSMAPQTGRER